MLDFINYSYANNIFFQYYICGLIAILGLVVGSFLNVVALRFLSGESIVFPPSKCPNCKTKLKWYDNIPVLAYILLMGKCRYCKKKISIQYPIVELLTGAFYLFIFLNFGFTLNTLMLWILASLSMVMCITDFKEQVVFDIVSIPIIPLGLAYSFFNIGNIENISSSIHVLGLDIPYIFVSSIEGTVIAFLLFEGLSLISKIFLKHRAFGEGDTIIAMGFAAWFGLKAILVIILLAVFLQAILTLPLMLFNLLKAKDKIAIISFITLLSSLLFPIILNLLDYSIVSNFTMLIILGIFSFAIISAILFLKRIKDLGMYTLLPFGPALILAGFIWIFFNKTIGIIF